MQRQVRKFNKFPNVCFKYTQQFSSSPEDSGYTDLVTIDIETVDRQFQRPYNLPLKQTDHVQKEMETLKKPEKSQNLIRAIKKAIYLGLNNPSLNKNMGKYHLPHIWDEVLFNISDFKLK